MLESVLIFWRWIDIGDQCCIVLPLIGFIKLSDTFCHVSLSLEIFCDMTTVSTLFPWYHMSHHCLCDCSHGIVSLTTVSMTHMSHHCLCDYSRGIVRGKHCDIFVSPLSPWYHKREMSLAMPKTQMYAGKGGNKVPNQVFCFMFPLGVCVASSAALALLL